MISEILSRSVQEIRRHENNAVYEQHRSHIISVIKEMETLQTELDASPETPKPKLRVSHITNEKYENDLKDAIVGDGNPGYVYDVATELSALFDYEEHDVHYGEVGWLVSNMPLTEELLKDEISCYLPEAEYTELTREELVERLPKMKDQARAAEIKEALNDGEKFYLVPENLKRSHEQAEANVTDVMLNDDDCILLLEDEDCVTIGVVEAKAPATDTE